MIRDREKESVTTDKTNLSSTNDWKMPALSQRFNSGPSNIENEVAQVSSSTKITIYIFIHILHSFFIQWVGLYLYLVNKLM